MFASLHKQNSRRSKECFASFWRSTNKCEVCPNSMKHLTFRPLYDSHIIRTYSKCQLCTATLVIGSSSTSSMMLVSTDLNCTNDFTYRHYLNIMVNIYAHTPLTNIIAINHTHSHSRLTLLKKCCLTGVFLPQSLRLLRIMDTPTRWDTPRASDKMHTRRVLCKHFEIAIHNFYQKWCKRRPHIHTSPTARTHRVVQIPILHFTQTDHIVQHILTVRNIEILTESQLLYAKAVVITYDIGWVKNQCRLFAIVFVCSLWQNPPNAAMRFSMEWLFEKAFLKQMYEGKREYGSS